MDNPTNQNHQPEQPNHDEATKISSQPSPEPANVVEVGTDAAVVPGTENETPVTVVVKPPKRSKLSTVVAIVFLILFLIGGGCLAYWYFGVYNKPENVALDAMRQFITAPSVTTNGKISIVASQSYASKVVVTVEFDSSSRKLPNSTTTKLSIAERDDDGEVIDDHEITIDLGSAIMSDGVIYLQISHLQESFDLIMENDDTPADNDFIDLIQDVIDLIDGEWWRISVPDLISELGDDEMADEFAEYYNCAIDVVNKADYSEIATIYTQNPFISVEKSDQDSTESGETIYNVKLENDAFAGFINAIPYTKLAEDAYACYNDDDSYGEVVAEEYEPITGADVERVIPDDVTILATINNGNHRLKKFHLDAANSKQPVTVDLEFDYSEVEVSAPESYRDVTELVDGISEIIYKAFNVSGKTPIDIDEFLEQTL